MIRKVYLINLIIIISITFSCKTHKYHNQMRKCINGNYVILKKDIGFSKSEKPILNDNFDIFISIKKFESLLIEKKLLKNKTKKGYKSLIENGINISNKKEIIDNVELKNPYFYSLHKYNTLFNNVFYASCPYDIVITKEGALAYYPTKAVFEEIIENGYPTKKHLMELLKVTDFKDETSRLLLCNLIFDNWYSKNIK